jgi:hypothetical protein
VQRKFLTGQESSVNRTLLNEAISTSGDLLPGDRPGSFLKHKSDKTQADLGEIILKWVIRPKKHAMHLRHETTNGPSILTKIWATL